VADKNFHKTPCKWS